MNINEINEFEAINQKTSERKFIAETERQCNEAYHRVEKAKAKKKYFASIVLTVLSLVLTMWGITALEMIGWINTAFCIVLMCVAGTMAIFKTGYLWQEIKN